MSEPIVDATDEPCVKTITYTAELDDVAEGERSVVHVITTDAVDRDREVVLPRGLDLERFRRNPVVLAGHAGDRYPIGKSLWVKPGKMGRALVAKTQFARTEDGEATYQLYRDGILSAWSIGFIPIESGRPTADELKARPDWRQARSIVRRAELIEYSAVAVPSNPEALTLAVAKGLTLPAWIPPLPPPPSDAPEPPPPAETLVLPSLRDVAAMPSLRGAKTTAQLDAEMTQQLLMRDWDAVIAQAVRDQLDRLMGRI